MDHSSLVPFQTIRDGMWFACLTPCHQQLMAHETKIVAIQPKFVFCVTYVRLVTPVVVVRDHTDDTQSDEATSEKEEEEKKKEKEKEKKEKEKEKEEKQPMRRSVPPSLQTLVSSFTTTTCLFGDTTINRLTFDTRHELVTWHLYARPHNVHFESYGMYLSPTWDRADRIKWLTTGRLDGVTLHGPDRHGISLHVETSFDAILERYDTGGHGVWRNHHPRWFISEKVRQDRLACLNKRAVSRKRRAVVSYSCSRRRKTSTSHHLLRSQNTDTHFM